MSHRVLVIEPSLRKAARLRQVLEEAFPEANARWYDPTESGERAPRFDWSRYDAVLLAQSLRLEGMNGIDWLARFVAQPDAPPIVFMSEKGERSMALTALKAGALDFLYRSSVTPEALRTVLDGINEVPTVTSTLEASQLFTSTTARGAPVRPKAADASRRRRRGGVSRRGSGPVMPPSGIEVPGYNVIGRVGEGGMASVFLAERADDRVKVVLKVVYIHDDSDPRDLRRFIREYNLIAQFDHPNVVRIHERAFAADYAYIAMEYFGGGDLAKRIAKGIAEADALSYLRAMATGLAVTHAHGIVHRDMKPGNVLFRDDGSVAISDFGISTELGSTRSITMAGQVMGTPQYMSPEQIAGRDADPRTDIYALGVILFEMLTGRRPYDHVGLRKLMYAHMTDPVPQMPESRSHLQALVEHLMAKHPGERPQSAVALIETLDSLRA